MGTQIKGSSLDARVRYAEERLGTAGFEKALASLSTKDRQVLQKVFPAGLYSLELVSRLDRAIATLADPTHPDRILRDLGRFSADLNLGNVHKVFVRGQSPHDLLARFPSVRATYYSDGEAAYERVAPTSGTIRVARAETQTDEDCESTAGYFQRGLEIMGATRVRVEHSKCSGRGDACCEFRCTWDTVPVHDEY